MRVFRGLSVATALLSQESFDWRSTGLTKQVGSGRIIYEETINNVAGRVLLMFFSIPKKLAALSR
jgi:hypothetical protein